MWSGFGTVLLDTRRLVEVIYREAFFDEIVSYSKES